MEALIERQRIVRERLTDVIGKVDDFLLTEQPPIHELSDLLKTLTEQSDCLAQINREVENTVDIENLVSVMFEAFDFEGMVEMK